MPVSNTIAVPIKVEAPVLGAARLRVPLCLQEQSQWCWAGCAQMLMQFFGDVRTRQCDLATWLHKGDCCRAPTSTICNNGATANEITSVHNKQRIKHRLIENYIAENALRAELDQGRPVEVAYLWDGGGGHVAIVYGWTPLTTGGNAYLVHDPAYGSHIVSYDFILTAYKLGKWFLTFMNIERR